MDLAEAQGLGAEKAKELKDKQDAATIASNNLDRATRGLSKAMGDANWAYVDMGMQALSVAGNLGTFYASVSKLTPAIGGLGTAAGTTSGAIGSVGGAGLAGVGLAGALAVLISLPILAHVQALGEAAKAYDALGGSIKTTTGEVAAFVDNYQAMAETTGLGGTRQLMANPDVSMPGVSPDLINAPAGTWVNSTEPTTKSSQDKGPGGLIGWFNSLKQKSKETREQELPALSMSFDTNMKNMANTSQLQINNINADLDSIPNDIYTYHHIITVYK
jgi:hypothetical protein